MKKITVHIRSRALAKTSSTGDAWWDDLSREQQKQYIKDHPNSKYAKAQLNPGATVKEDHKKKKPVEAPFEKPGKVKKVVNAVKQKFKDKIKELAEEHKHYFNQEQNLPGSKERTALSKHLRADRREIVHHIKGQVKEWKDGCHSILKLARGKQLSPHDKKALKALVIDSAVIAASVGITGGFAHGTALALKHTGFDVLKDVVIKAVVRGTMRATGVSAGATGLTVALEALASDSDAKISEDQILSMVVDSISKYVKDGNVPDDVWEKVIDELGKKGKKK